jgi:very-short-patch-repair endonuclease
MVARWQLLEAGISAGQIRWRLRHHRLRRILDGVYLSGAVEPAHAHEMAALLAYRFKATLSHRTAAALWEFLTYPATAAAWVTISPALSATRPEIAVHQACLRAADIRRRHGMALTSPPRTVLDCAALIPDNYGLERLVAEANYRGLASEAELREQLDRNPGKRGNKRLRSVLDLPGGPRRTRSPAERALLRLFRERGITEYETNVKVGGYEVDFLFRDAHLAIEVDGYDAHSGRVAFERDRLKAATLKAQGISTMPITGRQIRQDPDGVVGRLLAALGRANPR